MSEPAEIAGHGDAPQPLPGEAGIPSVALQTRPALSWKYALALVLAVASLIVVGAVSIQRYAASGRKPDDPVSKQASDRPAAATAAPRKLDLSAPAPSTPSSTGPKAKIPAIVPTDDELAEPIGVRRTGQATSATGSAARSIPPEDAPALLVTSRPASAGDPGAAHRPGSTTNRAAGAPDDTNPSDPLEDTRRNLKAYEQQLQVVLDSLSQSAATPGSSPSSLPSARATTAAANPPGSSAAGGLFGGQLQRSQTPRVAAARLGNRSLILPKGTAFTCALQTKVVSAASGFVSCLVQRNVFGDDGRVLLVERGSQVDGEYRVTSFKPGTVRIPVLWTRIKTPNGVTVDLDSPGTGQLGESGIDGYVDNRWGERIGAALLLSLIDDSVQLALAHEQSHSQGNSLVFPSTTTTSSKMAEKILDSTINIPPLIYRNQGGIVGVYVARDVDFSSVYELRPTPTEGRR